MIANEPVTKISVRISLRNCDSFIRWTIWQRDQIIFALTSVG